jgi:molybdopterin converting factor small subunit
MQVHVKLMASLRGKLPPGNSGGVAELDLQTDATVTIALAQLGIGAGQVHLVMVNGEQEPNRERRLHENDELVVFPPVAGG